MVKKWRGWKVLTPTSSKVRWLCLPLFSAASTYGLPDSSNIWQILWICRLLTPVPWTTVSIETRRTSCTIDQQRSSDILRPFVMDVEHKKVVVWSWTMNKPNSHGSWWHQNESPFPNKCLITLIFCLFSGKYLYPLSMFVSRWLYA